MVLNLLIAMPVVAVLILIRRAQTSGNAPAAPLTP